MCDSKVNKNSIVTPCQKKKKLFLHSKGQTLSLIASSLSELSEFNERCKRLNTHCEDFIRYQNDLAKTYIQIKEL